MPQSRNPDSGPEDGFTFRMVPAAGKPPPDALDETIDDPEPGVDAGAATIRLEAAGKRLPAHAGAETLEEEAADPGPPGSPPPARGTTGTQPGSGGIPVIADTLDEDEPPGAGELAATLDEEDFAPGQDRLARTVDEDEPALVFASVYSGTGFVDIYRTMVEGKDEAFAKRDGEEPSSISTIIGDAAPGGGFAGAGDSFTPGAMRREWGAFSDRSSLPGGHGVTIHVADAEARRTAEASVTLRPGTVSASAVPSQIGDYVLTEAIGVGGMGAVFRARQTSLNRNVAVKFIRPENVASDRVKNKFIAEAVLTGALDHPNIIPIHELGVTPDAGVFYAMKEVKGRAWSSVMREKSEAENLDILLRVADAVAFAHDRGVVHRDLKPENVMLGDFGEVLVMDWGISLPYRPLADGTRIPAGRAGTPAYMAPEMARADTEQIGPASDIYLLGAILYELATGVLPHAGDNLYTCIASAANNAIEPCDRGGELVDIARKAMSTQIEDRYRTVQDFQQALRQYLRHQESVTLAERADRNIESALANPDDGYDKLNQAIFGYSEALALWPDNASASRGERAARLALAGRAHGRGDFDLALGAVLPLAGDPEATALSDKAKHDKTENEARAERIRRLWRIAIGLTAAIILVLATATFMVQRQYRRAGQERDKAVAQEQIANNARLESERQRRIAEEALANEKAANEKALAEQQAKLAAVERQREEEGKRKLAEAETARRIEELARAGQLEDSSKWALTRDEAVRKQAGAAAAIGMAAPGISIKLPGGRSVPFSLIPPGEFIMGSPVKEKGRRTDEYLHPVSIGKPYLMAVNELTRAEWRSLVPVENEGEFVEERLLKLVSAGEESVEPWRWRTLPVPPEEADLPATGLSPKDVRDKLLPALAGLAPTGYVLRLPTEAEWEYAARAGTPSRFHSGDDNGDALRAGWLVYNSDALPHAVGTLEANAWNLRDLVGNAYELTADEYDSEAYRRLPSANPWWRPGEPEQACHVVRGGSMESDFLFARSAARNNIFWDNRSAMVGVRLVVGPPLE